MKGINSTAEPEYEVNLSSTGPNLSTTAFERKRLVGLNVLLWIVVATCVYLLAAMTFYLCKISRQNANDVSSSKLTKMLWFLGFVNVCLTMLYGYAVLVLYNLALHSDLVCNMVRNLIMFVLVALDATIYSFLWIRQYVVFTNMTFNGKFEKRIITLLEWSSLTFIVGVFITSCVLIFGFRRYIFDSEELKCVSVTSAPADLALTYLWTVGSITLHFVLVLLFAYPLVKILRFRNTSVRIIRPDSDMGRMVRRCLFISIACVGTDIFVMVLAEHTHLLPGSQLRKCVYTLNVLFNSMLLMMTFNEWRSIFFPWIS